MTKKDVVLNLDSELIGTIKSAYDKLNLNEEDVIEFTEPFVLHVSEYDPETFSRFKVPVTVVGMMHNYLLAGTHMGDEFEFPVDTVESTFSLAHIADVLEDRLYTVKSF